MFDVKLLSELKGYVLVTPFQLYSMEILWYVYFKMRIKL